MACGYSFRCYIFGEMFGMAMLFFKVMFWASLYKTFPQNILRSRDILVMHNHAALDWKP